VAKPLCRKIHPRSKAENAIDYRKEILAKFPQTAEFEVVARRFELTMHPWEEWSEDKSPFWWKAYNDVKHQRDTRFEEANLRNAERCRGLFVACLYLYKEQAEAPALSPSPEVLTAARRHLRGVRTTGVDVYKLD